MTPLDHALDAGIGVGEQCGPARVEWGDGIYELSCTVCTATWVGPIGEPCQWCERADARMRAETVRMLLRRPDVDPADGRYDDVITAWGKRLARAVSTGLIDDGTARRAWKRAGDAAA